MTAVQSRSDRPSPAQLAAWRRLWRILLTEPPDDDPPQPDDDHQSDQDNRQEAA